MNIFQSALQLFGFINSLTGNIGLTIIVIAAVSKLATLPLTKSTLKYSKQMQDIKPKLDELKTKYKDDKKKQMEENARLLREANINPIAGCLPMVLQLVLVIFLYNVLTAFLHSGANTHFLWFDLSKPDILPISGVPFGLKIPGILVILTAVSTLINSKMMMPRKKDMSAPAKDDFASQMQSQTLITFPIITLLFGTLWPSGLALYWVIGTVIDIIQRYYTVGLGGLADWLPGTATSKK